MGCQIQFLRHLPYALARSVPIHTPALPGRLPALLARRSQREPCAAVRGPASAQSPRRPGIPPKARASQVLPQGLRSGPLTAGRHSGAGALPFLPLACPAPCRTPVPESGDNRAFVDISEQRHPGLPSQAWHRIPAATMSPTPCTLLQTPSPVLRATDRSRTRAHSPQSAPCSNLGLPPQYPGPHGALML